VIYEKAEWVIEDKKPAPEWPQNGKVKFKDYSVRYRPELDHALKSINTTIAPGEKVSLYFVKFFI
jgi:ABC-type multidrug transport system fused ATPase/permease subunit